MCCMILQALTDGIQQIQNIILIFIMSRATTNNKSASFLNPALSLHSYLTHIK